MSKLYRYWIDVRVLELRSETYEVLASSEEEAIRKLNLGEDSIRLYSEFLNDNYDVPYIVGKEEITDNKDHYDHFLTDFMEENKSSDI